ncbi:Protein FAM178B [Galemys pyrenaicus]|uniref:Protein FAM178B n=1 Tax=Galemys pyrenaicus TaxID=202257 RepID=A0A8J6DIQ4_GALPY|nr:Protein FAM178B [Galemys pyrenaicus]
MARPQKTLLAPPQREGVQAATLMPIPLPALKRNVFDHPLHLRSSRRLCSSSRRLCSPNSAPTPKLPKKPKMQTPGDMFPVDWSPPPIDFLNPRAPHATKGAPAQTQVDTAGSQDQKRPDCQLPEELEQEPQEMDPKGELASLQELFLNLAGPNQKVAVPVVDTHTSLTSAGSGSYINSLDYLLQEKREQALELEREKQLLQNCVDLNSLELEEDEVLLTPEHRMLVQRFSVSMQVIPPVHPGETVFLPRQQPLPCILNCSHLKPRNHLEGMFFSSPLAQQLAFLRRGLLSNLYRHTPDCPLPLLPWLFQLLSWPPETSSRAFDLLWDLSMNRLFHQFGQY